MLLPFEISKDQAKAMSEVKKLLLFDKHYHVIKNRLSCNNLNSSVLDEFYFAKNCADANKILFTYNNHGDIQLPLFVFSIDPANYSNAFLDDYFTGSLSVTSINRECSIFIDFFLGKYEDINELVIPLDVKLDLVGFQQVWDEVNNVTIIRR